MTTNVSTPVDVIDHTVPLAPGEPLHSLRRERPKIVAATQGSYEAMFSPSVTGISVVERLLIALHACRLSGATMLAAHYQERLQAEGADITLVAAADDTTNQVIAADSRMRILLAFTRKLILKPIEGDRKAVDALISAGLSTPAVVAVAQLIAYLSYQIRLQAGLRALAAAEVTA